MFASLALLLGLWVGPSTPGVTVDVVPEAPAAAEPETAEPGEPAEAEPEAQPAAAAESEPAPQPPSEEQTKHHAGFNAEFQAGIGAGRRRIGPVAGAGTGGVEYPQAAPVAEVAIRLGGVPEKVRTVEVFGTMGLRSAFASRISVTSETGTPRRPRARSMQGLIALGVLGWPRALDRKFGLGPEIAYGLYPFLVESKVGVPSFLLHGPLVALRLESELADRVVLSVRPFVGVVFTDAPLRRARYHERGLQWGATAQVAVRIYGFIHAYVNYIERHAPLPYGNGGAIDDLERAGVLGLMIRGTRDPQKR